MVPQVPIKNYLIYSRANLLNPLVPRKLTSAQKAYLAALKQWTADTPTILPAGPSQVWSKRTRRIARVMASSDRAIPGLGRDPWHIHARVFIRGVQCD